MANPAHAITRQENFNRVYQFFQDNLCATSVEARAATGLGYASMARYVKAIRGGELPKYDDGGL